MIVLLLVFGSMILWILGMIIWQKYNESLCNKYGHVFKLVRHNIMMEGGSYRSICTDYIADIPTCKRWGCNFKKDPIIIQEVNSYTSVSMSSERWDELKKNGYIINN